MNTEEEEMRQQMQDAGFTDETIQIFITCIFDKDDD